MNTLEIVGYEREGYCDHCGRAIVHCIRLSDGRVVGATCFDKKLTAPLYYFGKPYRVGASNIIKRAKVAQRYPIDKWGQFGFNETSMIFKKA